ncbi:hypothetical protein ACIQ9P_23850 [Kitasatospora sp. NPDC094019]|uniref:hypothetical protein n=1 Tax=Kitasatospora sp. NPDC094019 TaxID=3364091 RepID=UPI00380DD128
MTVTIDMPEDPEEPDEDAVPQKLKVTPEIAEIFLSRNSVNRRLDKSHVQALVEAILRGEWQLTHQGIGFDRSGRLLDGQHRLHAIVEAGVPVEMFVWGGLSEDVFPVLDTVKRRSAADALSSTGEKYLTLLSSTIRHVLLFRTMPNEPWVGVRSRMSNDRILAEYKADVDSYRVAVSVGRELAKHIFASQTALAVGYFLTTEAAPAADIDDWTTGLKSGANLDPGDARLVLREVPKETHRRGSKRRLDMRDQLSMYIKAWNAWVRPDADSELVLRRLRKKEKMPTPVKERFTR